MQPINKKIMIVIEETGEGDPFKEGKTFNVYLDGDLEGFTGNHTVLDRPAFYWGERLFNKVTDELENAGVVEDSTQFNPRFTDTLGPKGEMN